MFDHHTKTIENVKRYFASQGNILAVLLGGSIAHNFATEQSDVDIMIVVSEEEFESREKSNDLLFFNRELSTYNDGYVDGKYMSQNYIKSVAKKGSEPARYAFKDSKVIYSNIDGLDKLINLAAAFPAKDKAKNQKRFYAQIHAWKWYFYEAKKHDNEFLLQTAISYFILFACRTVLCHNNLLYPYLKWMLHEVENAPIKPVDLINDIDHLLSTQEAEVIEKITSDVKNLNDWGVGDWDWARYFYDDIESVWMRQSPPVHDI